MEKEYKGITIKEVMSRLRISRCWILNHLTHNPNIKHIEKKPSKGAKVIYDGEMLRAYFMNQAVFSRQTKRISLDFEIEKYKKSHSNIAIDKTAFLGNIPDMKKIKRSELPAISVNSFDFWDLDLLFPKEYTQGNSDENAPIKTTEYCYRDMFRAGAIKIQLGTQKTMFYIPSEDGVIQPHLSDVFKVSLTASNYYLVPADWEPFYKGVNLKTDKRNSNHGTFGHDGSNAGRFALPKEEQRRMRSLRATDKEWALILAYANKIKNEKL